MFIDHVIHNGVRLMTRSHLDPAAVPHQLPVEVYVDNPYYKKLTDI